MSQIVEEKETKSNDDASKCKRRYFIFVKYPKANGAKQIINILQRNGFEVDYCYDINQLKEGYHDVLIIPGGTARVQQKALGEKGLEKILSFVSNGGGYIGFCAGAFLGSYQTKLKNGPLGLKLLDSEFYLGNIINKTNVKGKIIMRINPNDDNSFIETNLITVKCIYHNGAFWDRKKLHKSVKIIGLIKHGIKPHHKEMNNKACIIGGHYNKGKVVLCGPHPEQTLDLSGFTLKLLKSVLPT
eukprot:354224_1